MGFKLNYILRIFRHRALAAVIDSIRLRRFVAVTAVLACAALLAGGCQEAVVSDSQQVSAFEKAGPITPKVDLDSIYRAKSDDGLYKISSGDVLEFRMPAVMSAFAPSFYKDDAGRIEPHLSRVDDKGNITLPIVGQLHAAGSTLPFIESKVVNLYYPRYLVSRPSVVCQVKEYYTENVTLVGAVDAPGVYKMKNNEMSLVSLLMKAGGIIEEGASVITIKNPKRKGLGKDYTVSKTPKIETTQREAAAAEAKKEIDSPAYYTEPVIEQAKDNNADFEELEFDLVYSPGENSKGGLLKVTSAGTDIYSRYIDLTDSAARADYIAGLEKVIGTKQSRIIGFAINQLAEQMASAESQNVLSLSTEDEMLMEVADDYAAGANSNCLNCGDNASYNEEYITYPAHTDNNKYTRQEVEFVTPVEPQAEVDSSYVADAPPDPAAASDTIVLPIKGLNIPFADISLMQGDVVEVRRLNQQVFTVMGLVQEPGAFPYPPDVEYNLMQALGFAGGIDLIADPRYVSVYRQDTNGQIVSATFRIDKDFRSQSYGIKIKPGDVVSVEVTPRTKMNVLLHQILRLNVGFYVRPGFID